MAVALGLPPGYLPPRATTADPHCPPNYLLQGQSEVGGEPMLPRKDTASFSLSLTGVTSV